MVCKIYNHAEEMLIEFEVVHFSQAIRDGVTTLSIIFPMDTEKWEDTTLEKFHQIAVKPIYLIKIFNGDEIVAQYTSFEEISSIATNYSSNVKEGVMLLTKRICLEEE